MADDNKLYASRFWLLVPLPAAENKQSAAASALPRVTALGESAAIAELKAMADEGMLLLPHGFVVSNAELERDPQMRELVDQWEKEHPEKIKDYRTKNVPHKRGAEPTTEETDA